MAEVTEEYSSYAKIICTIAIYKKENNMEYRVFSKYYQLSLKNITMPILCEMDSEHPILVPNLQIDDEGNDIIYLYCLDCNFKLYPGLELYRNIEFVLEEVEVNEEN